MLIDLADDVMRDVLSAAVVVTPSTRYAFQSISPHDQLMLNPWRSKDPVFAEAFTVERLDCKGVPVVKRYDCSALTTWIV